MYPESILIEPTKRTPRIILERGKIIMTGRSMPENPSDFYSPIYEWILNYLDNCAKKTDIILGFELINTMSIKWIFAILRELEKTFDMPCQIRILWYYEDGDEEICDLGHVIRTLVRCPLKVIKVSDIADFDFLLENSLSKL